MKRFPALAVVLLALAPAAASAAPRAPSPAIAAAVADPGRPDADTANDANRKPAQVLAFAGVKPGMTVAELAPGGGYYTRLLAKAVGPRGKVYALVTPGAAAHGLAALIAVADANPNVIVTRVASYTDLALPTKADLFWTTENYHDFHNGPAADIAATNKAVYANLKPGGVFYVEDNSAAPGAGLAATSSVHRMDEDLAKTELAAAGFRLDVEGDLLRNPADDRTQSMAAGGHFSADRFMLRLRK